MSAESIKQYLAFQAGFQKDHVEKAGFKTSPAQFLLEHGREFKFDKKSFKHKKGPIKQCYANAGRRVLMDFEDLTYVEGYVLTCIPIQHAWLADKDGHVIETTIRHGNDHVKGYFGVPIKREYLRKTVAREKAWGVFSNWMSHKWLTDDPKEIVEKLK